MNRLDTHPLDEAAMFKRLFDMGKSVEELAMYYSRSVSGIYHRIRLNNLIDEIKDMFRGGRSNITGASALAGLTSARQHEFLEKIENANKVEAYRMIGALA